MSNKINKNIVFVADRVHDFLNSDINSTNLECVEDNYFNAVYEALTQISDRVTHYNEPKEFLNNIQNHADDVVLTIWSGQLSRNRKAILQSICEAYNIPYVGADAYLQIIAEDKYLCKNLYKKFDIDYPRGVLINNVNDYSLLNYIKYPAIIKPNMEGGSIGIFNDNLVYTPAEAVNICNRLINCFNPLIAEEYIEGQEISICIAGINDKVDVFEVIELSVNGNNYFKNEIFGAETKKINPSMRRRNSITSTFPISEKNKLLSLYSELGKAEVLRMDGRIRNNKFYMIELTPDCCLSAQSSMAVAFRAAGYTYTQMFYKLIDNCIKAWEYQNANKL